MVYAGKPFSWSGITTDDDLTVLTDHGRPRVFYELLDNNAHTLYLTKTGGQIVFTFAP